MKLNPTLVKLRDRFCVNKKIKSFRQYHTNNKEERVENCYEGGLGIANHLSQRKQEQDARLVSYKIKGNHI